MLAALIHELTPIEGLCILIGLGFGWITWGWELARLRRSLRDKDKGKE